MASPGMSIHDQAKEGTLTRSWLQDHLSKEPDDLDEYNFDGYTPLSLAVREGQVGAVKLLLLKKADANKTVRDGRTPLYIAMSAKQSTERIAQLLLAHGANVNFPIEEWGNETAIMAAITQSRDPEVVRLLVENGASLTRANDRGDTARSLADQSANPAIHKALLPKDKQEGWQTELESLLAGGIDDPQTKEEFKEDLFRFIEQQGLEDIFPSNSQYVNDVAENAIKARNSSPSLPVLGSSARIRARASLYKVIFYCDDSGSMDKDDRWGSLKSVVNAMTEVMTGLAPKYQRTVQLRFINKDETSSDLQPSEILGKLNFKPNGGTKIGTVLNDKVLKPFVKDVIDGGRVLDRPYLVIAITDGHPESEDTGKFRSVVSEYRDYITSNGYSKHGKNCQPRILQENSLFSKLYHSPLHQPQPDRE
ncbi:unnamed protein product [Penicillium nalgiovense]|uniref:VWFA domain-containing protein n=1 Tax=Penicillium nalgiovense TaxID=60175 RepID=A0A9W4HJ92_PENNA|nr:unnamed protein product [Penicillium nalgiovense]CAG8014543.1 unnamed protein product [Penicillium nalgiovense]CAG8031197.1 unnamed protein product [Penicillium nalgiovense]CAG8038924.1 unnamed protein product [Penicillium nalgiovense]CAG8041918.1 unnamed protein product [Penicillium nalgiovense]